jgi:hypothetical protein
MAEIPGPLAPLGDGAGRETRRVEGVWTTQ